MCLLCSKLRILLITAHMVSDYIALQTYSELRPVFGSVHHPPSKGFVSFLWCGGCCLPFGWILNAGFKVLWMLGRIASLAKSSSFQEGVPFIPFLQWFYDTKSCRPKLTQRLELFQIMTFSITVSSLELVKSGAVLPADSSVFKSLLPAATESPSFCIVGWGTRNLGHTHNCYYFC